MLKNIKNSLHDKSVPLFMQDNQIKVINWIRSGMEYTEGFGLLVELTQNQCIPISLPAGENQCPIN